MITREDHEHAFFEELLDGALDGTLAPEERADLDAHLSGCLECRERMALVLGAAAAWKAQPDIALEPDLRDAVFARVMEDVGAKPRRAAAGPRRSRRALVWAAIVVPLAAAAGIALAVGLPQDPAGASLPRTAGAAPVRAMDSEGATPLPSETPAALDPPVVARVSSIHGRAMAARPGRLPVPVTDGALLARGDTVTLEGDAAADVEIPGIAAVHLERGAVSALAALGTQTRLALRRGVLSTHVAARGGDAAFAIETPAGTVEVTGTVFEVEVDSAAAVRVRVAEGAVVVRDVADPNNAVSVRAGEQLPLDWSKPSPAPLADAEVARILSVFGRAENLGAVARLPVPAAAAKGGVEGEELELLFAKAEALRRGGATADAIAVYEAIADRAQRPDVAAEALFAVGQMKLLGGEAHGALTALLSCKGLGRTPYWEMAAFYAARAYADLGLCAEAIRAADELVAAAPTHGLALRAGEIRAKCGAPAP